MSIQFDLRHLINHPPASGLATWVFTPHTEAAETENVELHDRYDPNRLKDFVKFTYISLVWSKFCFLFDKTELAMTLITPILKHFIPSQRLFFFLTHFSTLSHSRDNEPESSSSSVSYWDDVTHSDLLNSPHGSPVVFLPTRARQMVSFVCSTKPNSNNDFSNHRETKATTHSEVMHQDWALCGDDDNGGDHHHHHHHHCPTQSLFGILNNPKSPLLWMTWSRLRLVLEVEKMWIGGICENKTEV